LAEKLRVGIEAPYLIDGKTIFIGASIGLSFYPDDTTELLELLHLADKAMYLNKAERK